MRAFITGVSGQDGYYLSRLLLSKDYEVHGLIRRGTNPNSIDPRIRCHVGDLTDPASLRLAIDDSTPDEVYHLGAQSHVKASFEEPEYTFQVTAMSTERILRILRDLKLFKAKFYQASSSELFGDAPAPQNEDTPFRPRSPYAIAKAAAHYTVKMYREAYGMFAVGGILFNHTGERRPETFVTRKITRAAARIKLGKQKELVLGNLDAKRDWGYAGDYVVAMWLMLQQKQPRDYVIATGETHSVREFLTRTFTRVGLTWQDYVKTDSKFERPAEVPELQGDSRRAREELGWKPKVDFEQLVIRMVAHDLELARTGG